MTHTSPLTIETIVQRIKNLTIEKIDDFLSNDPIIHTASEHSKDLIDDAQKLKTALKQNGNKVNQVQLIDVDFYKNVVTNVINYTGSLPRAHSYEDGTSRILIPDQLFEVGFYLLWITIKDINIGIYCYPSKGLDQTFYFAPGWGWNMSNETQFVENSMSIVHVLTQSIGLPKRENINLLVCEDTSNGMDILVDSFYTVSNTLTQSVLKPHIETCVLNSKLGFDLAMGREALFVNRPVFTVKEFKNNALETLIDIVSDCDTFLHHFAKGYSLEKCFVEEYEFEDFLKEFICYAIDHYH